MTGEKGKNMTKKKVSAKKIILIVVVSFIVLLIAGDWFLSVSVYDEIFGVRYDNYEPLLFHTEDFDGLRRTKHEFTSDKGQKLTGYMYSKGEEQRGIIVLAHGLGSGHNSYMDCIDLFAGSGYYVFAYDATGTGESEGKCIGGLYQGVTDLDRAISFVEESGEFPALPVALFGHSWGGYCVSSVLKYHPEVRAVIECAGFNSSSDMFESQGKKEAGDFIYVMMPFIKLTDLIRFGSAASDDALGGFAASDAAVMVVHSSDDSTVPPEYGFDIYYEKYRNDPRFSFLQLEDRGHNCFNKKPSYINSFNTEYKKWLSSLDYDRNADENKARFEEEKAEYYRLNLDREQYRNMLDKELFDRFIGFFNEHITD